MPPIKLVVTSKNNLQLKYGRKFSTIDKQLKSLVKGDKKKGLDTKIVYIDDAVSAKEAGIKPVNTVTAKECKKAIDELFQKHLPAYIAIIGAQDVFPFQEIKNPAEDDDVMIPTDLPYACDVPYSTDISSFIGPTRVIGRIPDIPGNNDSTYLKTLLQNSIDSKPIAPEAYQKYFAVSAYVWKKSTEKSLQSIFGHNGSLLLSPPEDGKYRKTELRPLTHFINCHGAPSDYRYYGQKGNKYPEALWSTNLKANITPGTVVAAECCYGAELVDPTLLETMPTNGNIVTSIANAYLGNNALAFLGSSTIAYGPPDGQGLADLITQYFIKCIHRGASSGRALLEARQKFVSVSAPHLDPYELKTLAQFYLLGDPSVQPVLEVDGEADSIARGSIENNRIKLFSKGQELKNSVAASKKQKTASKSADEKLLKKLLKETDFENSDREAVYEVKSKVKGVSGLQKKLLGENARFRTFIKSVSAKKVCDYRVLVVKENEDQLLGWKVYISK